MVSSPFVAGFGMLVAGWHVKDNTLVVYSEYDQALAQRFEVCVNGLAMVACEANVPGAPPPEQPRDPALESLPQR